MPMKKYFYGHVAVFSKARTFSVPRHGFPSVFIAKKSDKKWSPSLFLL